MNTFPKIDFYMKRMAIIDRLPTKADHNTMLGAVIINACLTKQPVCEIIKMIKESANDNYKMMCNVIGEDLTNEILSL